MTSFDVVRWLPAGAPPVPGRLRLLDQTQLPGTLTYVETADPAEIYTAIQRLVVRGAPAIGIAAGYALLLAAQAETATAPAPWLAAVTRAADWLATARPTAVNLAWALYRCLGAARQAAAAGADVAALRQVLYTEATAIATEDAACCQRLGEHGLALLQPGCGILTHCNAGALATGGSGTALAPIYRAHAAGWRPRVFADETRPLLQGARLTAWELQQAGVDVTLICDNMAAVVMRERRVDLVIVGADRIAANGDTANKIGTYGVAVLARHHGIPFYVAAPLSTLDLSLPDGGGIPIEQRQADEVRAGFGRLTAPASIPVYNPAFDVTPASLITAIITDAGVLRPPFGPALAAARG